VYDDFAEIYAENIGCEGCKKYKMAKTCQVLAPRLALVIKL